VRRVFIGAYEDNIPFLGSALSFDILLAALPFSFLALAALGYFVQSGADVSNDVLGLLHRLLPSASSDSQGHFRRAEELIAGIVESRNELSLVGIPLFIWLATRAFSSARNALNEVFDTEESRHYFVGKAWDFSLMVVTLSLVVINTVFSLRAADEPWFGRFVTQLSTFALGVVLFFIVYRVAPARRIPWDTALVAAAVASLGFEIAKGLYRLYLTNFATVDRLISNANAIAVLLFVVWIYFTACVFLLGGEVAETYELMRRQRDQRTVLA
jgi:membrane protein